MIVLEGIRSSGKSFTLDVLKKNLPQLIFYKDLGMRIFPKEVDPDDYAIALDYTYAQCLPKLVAPHEHIIIDRLYFSSYVYGQAWRKTYDKKFWTNHIKTVEQMYGNFLKEITFVYLSVSYDDLDRIKKMNRKKDQWDSKHDFIRQDQLYTQLFNRGITKAKVLLLPAFQSEDFITQFFKSYLKL